MMNLRKQVSYRINLILVLLFTGCSQALGQTPKINVNWNHFLRESKTTPTLQVVVNPPLRRGSKIHDDAFEALRNLQCDYVRYVPWLPYPKLGVAELEPPKNGKTSWDFSLIDPMMEDLMEATQGHSTVLNFSTIPEWMFKTDHPVSYPEDPNKPVWNYEQGTELRDTTMTEVANYYARLLSWYTQGGFKDELGKYHKSGHHYSIPYWEVLNEPDLEHHFSPEKYTRLYDKVVEAMKKVSPETKFGGISLAGPSNHPRFFEYFLNPEHHNSDIPVDFITYHFYAIGRMQEPTSVWQHSFFDQADKFLTTVRYIEAIRKRLSPDTKTFINEIGSILSTDFGQSAPDYKFSPIPDSYWNLSGALYAYLFGQLSHMGIDVAGESQLMGYPTQFPSVSMIDWKTGQPNARYKVLQLIHNHFGPGDQMVQSGNTLWVYSYAVKSTKGKKQVLLVNRHNESSEITIPGIEGGSMEYVDQQTPKDKACSIRPLESDSIKLNGFSVAVVRLP